jgi:molybdopterin-containing oxidoreductase family membrane subunit
VFLLVLYGISKGSARPLGDALLQRLARLLAIFVAAGLYFVIVQHLTGLYFTKHHAFERFILVDGGVHTLLFWGGQVIVGGVLPLVLLLQPAPTRGAIVAAAALVVAGAFAQMYVTIIGGQAFPLVLFPGMQVTSSFRDGVVNAYAPSLPELLLGLGGVAIAGLIVLVAVRLLAFVPERLDD